MKYLIILALMLTAGKLQAQDTTQTYRYSAKVYANINRSRVTRANFSLTEVTVSPAFAFQMRNRRGNAHEFELTNFMVNASKAVTPLNLPTSQKSRGTSIVLRYEYIVNIMKRRSPRFAPAIGFGAAPFYNRYRAIPYGSTYSPHSATAFGFNGLIIPRVTYNISPRLYLDANIPISILDASHQRQTINNPALPAGRQRNSITSFNMFSGDFNARLGLGIKF